MAFAAEKALPKAIAIVMETFLTNAVFVEVMASPKAIAIAMEIRPMPWGFAEEHVLLITTITVSVMTLKLWDVPILRHATTAMTLLKMMDHATTALAAK